MWSKLYISGLTAMFVAVGLSFACLNVVSEECVSCARCNCHDRCHKVCRLVCEEKKVEVVCWGCEAEDFCVPGPSCPKCEHCEMVKCGGEEGGNDAVCTQPTKFVWTEWIPGCAKIFTKKKLMKRTITKKVPSYKWVVEDLCKSCRANEKALEITANEEIPAPPQVAGLEIIEPVLTR